MLRSERLGRPYHHMPRVVHHDVDVTVGFENPFNRGIHRRLRLHIHFHCPQIDAVVLREVVGRFHT